MIVTSAYFSGSDMSLVQLNVYNGVPKSHGIFMFVSQKNANAVMSIKLIVLLLLNLLLCNNWYRELIVVDQHNEYSRALWRLMIV